MTDSHKTARRMHAYAAKAKRMASAHRKPKRHRFAPVGGLNDFRDRNTLRLECRDCGQTIWYSLGNFDYYDRKRGEGCDARDCLHRRAMWRREVFPGGVRVLVACADCRVVQVLGESVGQPIGDLRRAMANNLHSFMPSYMARLAMAWDLPVLMRL